MKFWLFRKADDSQQNDFDVEARITSSDYECLWLLVCVTFNQILPGTDLYLCINSIGEPALIALPDIAVTTTVGKILYQRTNPSVILIQQIKQGKDQSYLMPAELTTKQVSIMSQITFAFNSGKLEETLNKYNWEKLFSDITVRITRDPTVDYKHEIVRLNILDNIDPKNPDDSHKIPGFKNQIPVFVYIDSRVKRDLSRQDFQREIVVRRLLCEDNISSVRNTLKSLPGWSSLQENDAFIHVINRAEVEIKLHMKSWPSFTDIMLNPEMAEFIPGPPPEIKLTPKGQEILKQTESRELISSISNWGDPDIAQVALHVNKFKGQSPKDSVTSPSITVFKDEMGIHSLQSKLFRIHSNSFSLGGENNSPVFLDALPAQQIPEICWKPIAEGETLEWWQTDVIAKKVLWLAAYNLASHAIGDPKDVIYAVTPIGNDVIQVALLFDDLDEGVPYAFAIIKGDFAIRAIPVFPTGTYDTQPDGSLISKKAVILKNYCITRNGDRIDLMRAGQLPQFIRPIYSSVVSEKYKEVI